MAEAEQVTLANGGMVTVCLGKGYTMGSAFAYHPQVHTIKTEEVGELVIPSQTKMVIHTDHIKNSVFQQMVAQCRRRRVVYLVRKTMESVEQELHKLLPKREGGNGTGAVDTPKPTKAEREEAHKLAERGSVSALAKEADLRKGSAEEGRRLFKVAQQRGIRTTLASITQCISKLKRTQGRGDIPLSVTPQSALVAVTAGLEEAIAALTRIRDHAETLEKDKGTLLKENAELKAKIQLMKEAFKGIDG